MNALKMVVVTASSEAHALCNEKVLADHIANRITRLLDRGSERIDVEVTSLVPEIGAVQFRKDVPAGPEIALRQIEGADLIIVSTTVRKGSYTGHFKHLIDLLRHDAIISVPLALAAASCDARHALIVEHQLRLLFGFFQAFTLPTAVVATDADFEDHQVVNPTIHARIDAVATEAALAIRSRTRHESVRASKVIEVTL